MVRWMKEIGQRKKTICWSYFCLVFYLDMEYQFIGLFLNVPVRHVITEVAVDLKKQVCYTQTHTKLGQITWLKKIILEIWDLFWYPNESLHIIFSGYESCYFVFL